MALGQALNGTAPERAPVINITQVTITGLGSHVADDFIVDRAQTGDPATGGNAVTASETPVTGAPFDVYFGGLLQVLNRDYTLNAGVVTFLSAIFQTGNVISLKYWKAA